MIEKIQAIIYTLKPKPQVLVLQRPEHRGYVWQPVTGKVDSRDVDLAAAVRREVQEETGLDEILAIQDLDYAFRFKRRSSDVIEHLFGIELARPVPVRLSAEHVDYAWLTPKEASKRLAWEINREGMRRVLEFRRSGTQP